jgi:hypothetical protein
MDVPRRENNRKEMKASRAQEEGRGANEAMGRALGYETVATTSPTGGGRTIAPYVGTRAWTSQSRGRTPMDAVGRGHGRHSDVGQAHVKVIEKDNK